MAERRFTRRQALQAAAAAGLAAGVVPALAERAGAMPQGVGGPGLRPLEAGLDLTVHGVIFPGSAQDYRVVSTQPWWPALRDVVGRLRMWADWPSLQPERDVALGDPASRGTASLLALDDQIRRAVEDGLSVMLIPYRYPPWANGTADLEPGSRADLAHMAGDRARAAAMEAAGDGVPSGFKAREYK